VRPQICILRHTEAVKEYLQAYMLLMDQKLYRAAIDCVFYAASHSIEAALAFFNEHPQDHRERFDLISRHVEFAKLTESYGELYRLRRWTTYRGFKNGDNAEKAHTITVKILIETARLSGYDVRKLGINERG